MAIVTIRGQIADYPWGGQGAISALLGWPAHSGAEAEWWLGTHPLRPSVVASSGESLGDWLESHGHQGELPYLVKVLAPATPLSLQVHPSAEQARAGFDAEERAGVPLTSPTRHYKDPHPKPELVVAIQRPFHALAGIRPVSETLATLDRIAGSDYPPMMRRWRERLESQPVGEVIAWLLSEEPKVVELLAELADRVGLDDTLARLHEYYPGDPGIAVGLMLNPVTLQPGQALFLDAGQLHAYLEGLAVEVMAPSDNVLRGGLTPKHVDVNELLKVASTEPTTPPLLGGQVDADGVVHFAPEGQGFSAHVLSGEQASAKVDLVLPALVVVLEGQWRVEGHGARVELGQGEAAVISAGGSPVTFTGSGQVWWVTPVV